jgi:hypothetical protein
MSKKSLLMRLPLKLDMPISLCISKCVAKARSVLLKALCSKQLPVVAESTSCKRNALIANALHPNRRYPNQTRIPVVMAHNTANP